MEPLDVSARDEHVPGQRDTSRVDYASWCATPRLTVGSRVDAPRSDGGTMPEYTFGGRNPELEGGPAHRPRRRGRGVRRPVARPMLVPCRPTSPRGCMAPVGG